MNPTPAASALPELLARWQQAPLRPPAGDVVARLAGWLGWTDAIALSGAVARSGGSGSAGGTAPSAAGRDLPPAGTDPRHRREALALRAELDDRLAWLHTSLADGLAQDETWQTDPLPARAGGRVGTGAPRAEGDAAPRAAAPTTQSAAGFAPLRRHLAAEQRRLEQFVADWRARLRQRLPAIDPALAAVAALDTVFEDTLRERERHLLAQAIGLLEQRFHALRQAETAPGPQAITPAGVPPRSADPATAGTPAGGMAGGMAADAPLSIPTAAAGPASAHPAPHSAHTAHTTPTAPPHAAMQDLAALPRLPPRRPIGRALASRQLAANAHLAGPGAAPGSGSTPLPVHKAGLSPAPDLPAWRRTLADEALALLQAELALRWAPVAGLLELLERAGGLAGPAPAAGHPSTPAHAPRTAPSPSRADRPLPPAAPTR
ncbi:MAG: hypothetical protein RLY78_2428 [Pseudomonadota bacterium]